MTEQHDRTLMWVQDASEAGECCGVDRHVFLEACQSMPFDQVEITTELSHDHVSFLCHDDGTLHRYPRECFLIDAQCPRAANSLATDQSASALAQTFEPLD